MCFLYLLFFWADATVSVFAYLFVTSFFSKKTFSFYLLTNAINAALSFLWYSPAGAFYHFGMIIDFQWKYDSQIVVFEKQRHFQN